MVIRLMRRFWCSGHSGVAATIATQFGFAMMPLCPCMAPALISGTTSGTSLFIRKNEELSTTTAPARTAAGAARREQRDIHAFEAGVGQFLDRDIAAAEFHRLANRTCGGQQAQLDEGKFALLEALHELDAYGTRGAGNGDNGILEVTFGLIVR